MASYSIYQLLESSTQQAHNFAKLQVKTIHRYEKIFSRTCSKVSKSHVVPRWRTVNSVHYKRNLKELRNCILRITRVWSLFVPYGFMQVYIFCRFFWETSVLYFCTFALCGMRRNLHKFCTIMAYIRSRCQVLCVFILTYF